MRNAWYANNSHYSVSIQHYRHQYYLKITYGVGAYFKFSIHCLCDIVWFSVPLTQCLVYVQHNKQHVNNVYRNKCSPHTTESPLSNLIQHLHSDCPVHSPYYDTSTFRKYCTHQQLPHNVAVHCSEEYNF